MTVRVSSAARIKVSHRAEIEVLRYAGNHALWHKHVHGVELDPMQVLKCIEMDRSANTIDCSCRRTGKTAVKELHALHHLATVPYQELGVVAPRLQQSINNLNYHLEAIRRSPILRGYVAWKSGREQLSDSRYAFFNHSKASAYGIMSQIDGDAISYASIEEVDDMPSDRLLSRFLPMLGSARRMGASRDASFKPQIRITGVFKGADTLQQMIDSKEYHLLPVVNVYLGIEMGILNESFMLEMRSQLPEGEYIRQFLCKNVSAQNHIWEKHIRRAMLVGLKAGLQAAEPMPGARYRKRGLVSFGYDHTGHGEGLTASKSALVVTEQIGNYVTFPFVHTWPAGTDDKVIERDLIGFWQYFDPDVAIGDAYGVGMLTSLNDRLFALGLTDVDRRTVGNGESTATTWTEWPFAPLRFEGMVKHSMATAVRSAFHNGQAAIPFFDDGVGALRSESPANVVWMPPDLSSIPAEHSDWTMFVRQLGNMKAEPTKASYARYAMANPKLGDDLFDSTMASVWGLLTRGALDVPTVIAHRTQSREQLLGGGLLIEHAA
ncbi:MAG: hypothetical protein KIT73_06835 [Burkholderiales bacterium]|nr:hypothetical protein [Burkholderiales bacterium]